MIRHALTTGETGMLTNVGAAGIQQLLVHNRHTVLRKNRPGLEGEGSAPFLTNAQKWESSRRNILSLS